MTEPIAQKKRPGRVSRSLDEEIEFQREKLRKLEARKKEEDRKTRERNQRGILQLIASEGLDDVGVEAWKNAMPQIKAALQSAAGA